MSKQNVREFLNEYERICDFSEPCKARGGRLIGAIGTKKDEKNLTTHQIMSLIGK
jgi:hypothetical protein